jgi:hypothetical protein
MLDLGCREKKIYHARSSWNAELRQAFAKQSMLTIVQVCSSGQNKLAIDTTSFLVYVRVT